MFFVEKVQIYDQERIAIVECVDSNSYERNLQCSEVERGLFLFSENEVGVDDLSCGSAEIQILSIQAAGSTYSILKQKVDEIEGITDIQKERFYRVFQENINVFSDKIGLCNAYVHEFQVVNTTPYHHKCRNVPLAMLEKTDEAIQKMLRENIIEPSDSEHVNALCLVQKTDGTVRVTIDARQVNSMTMPNHYQSESVQAQLNKVNGAKWYSILDLTHAFLQVTLAEHCRGYTAFLHRGNNIDLPVPLLDSPPVAQHSPEL